MELSPTHKARKLYRLELVLTVLRIVSLGLLISKTLTDWAAATLI